MGLKYISYLVTIPVLWLTMYFLGFSSLLMKYFIFMNSKVLALFINFSRIFMVFSNSVN
jgi:hypothetical protein